MRTLPVYILAMLALLIVSCGEEPVDQTNYTIEVFQTATKGADEATVDSICRDFLDHAEDVEVLRTAQNTFLDIDDEAAREFARKQAQENSKSATCQYLYGRTLEDPIEQIKVARKAIELDPEFGYGYRLAVATYAQHLFAGDETSDNYGTIKEMLAEDGDHFAKYAAMESPDNFPTKGLIQYQLYTGDKEAAAKTIAASEEKLSEGRDQLDLATYYAGLGEYDRSLELMTANLTARKDAGELSADDLDYYLTYYYTSGLNRYKAYDKVIEFYKAQPGFNKNADNLYSVACAYSLNGDADNAFSYLGKATKAGWDKVVHTGKDTDLNALHADSRWDAALAAVQKKWDSGKPDRKKEALSHKLDLEAPPFELEDANGTKVSLASLKGNVVVLDFWATWCGPCRAAMPMIDKFVEEDAGDKVKVFSVNVWETGRKKPIKYMEENEYDMTLLFGDNDLAKAYEVRGIPTLVVIDQDGKIRYRESGVSEALGENLVWWTQDLL